MGTSKAKKEVKKAKLFAVHQMNTLNIPTILLDAFNQRRKEDSIMKSI